MDDNRRVANYFVIAGLPKSNPELLDEYNLEINLKPSGFLDPITHINVIIPSLGEEVPYGYEVIGTTPSKYSANLNHGSFRSSDIFLIYKRGRSDPPLLDIGVIYTDKERILPDSQLVEFTVDNHSANINNGQSSGSRTYLTYRRSNHSSPCNELVVNDIAVINASKGEVPPHSFTKIDKNLNTGMMGSDLYICYKKSLSRPDHLSYKPGLLYSFPPPPSSSLSSSSPSSSSPSSSSSPQSSSYPHTQEKDSNERTFVVNDNVALFCLPMGASIECVPQNSNSFSTSRSSFVLSPPNSERIYGSAITFYEEIDESELSSNQRLGLHLSKYSRAQERKILGNKAICLLSHWPFFEAFEAFLFFLCKRQIMGPHETPLETYISHFLYDLPFPSPSRPRILYQLSSSDTLCLYLPQEIPLPRTGASFRNLLLNLGPENCLLLLLLSLLESKILLHSHRPHVLTSVAEAVTQILFPLFWQCPYIPLCPLGMSSYLAAPLPFIIGLDSKFFDNYVAPFDVNAVDLDTNTITLSSEKRYLRSSLSQFLPKKPGKILHSSLLSLHDKILSQNSLARTLQATDDGTLDFDFKMKSRELELEYEIREAFLSFMVSILLDYRIYLVPISKEPSIGATDVMNLFDQEGFLNSRHKSHRQFYELLMKTQMFTKFIEERSFVSDVNTSLAFFDECMDKVLLTKGLEAHSFLELANIDSDSTVFILPPEASYLTHKRQNYVYEKIENLNKELFYIPEKYKDNRKDTTKNVNGKKINLAKRTSQEIKWSQRQAAQGFQSDALWGRILVQTIYSLWFTILPSYISKYGSFYLRSGLFILRRLHRLECHSVDEICYRVMMQLCGQYHEPILALQVLNEMKRISRVPNAVTYGYYNKALLESVWPKSESSESRSKWKNILPLLRRKRKDVKGSTLERVKGDEDSPRNENNDINRLGEISHEVLQEDDCSSRTGESVSRALFQNGDEDKEQEPPGNTEHQESSSSRSHRSHSLDILPTSLNSPRLLDPMKKNSSFSPFSHLKGIPVTMNDPLGAFSTISTKMSSFSKVETESMESFVERRRRRLSSSSSSCNSYYSSHPNDILGEPFSDSFAPKALERSTTVPRSLSEEEREGGRSVSSSGGGVLGSPFSLKNLSRFKKGSSYLIHSLSPNRKTTMEAWNKGLSSVQSVAAFAVTNISKRVEDLKNYSDHSSSPSFVRDQRDEPWSNFPGSLSQLWKVSYQTDPRVKNPIPNNNPNTFLSFYSKCSKRSFLPMALQVKISSTSKCINCSSLLYDEDIMGGWTSEDSNLNTKCLYCHKMFVPFLSIQVLDYRSLPITLPTFSISPKSELINSSGLLFTTTSSSNNTTKNIKPLTYEKLSIPYLCPLVLQKEVEKLLERKGDGILNHFSVVVEHSILYWNLLWYFSRISIVSQLPAHLLTAYNSSKKSSSIHVSWSHLELNHHNVHVECLWNNEDFIDESAYKECRNSNSYFTNPLLSHIVPFSYLNSHRLRSQKIIEGIKTNDLYFPIKLLLEERISFLRGKRSSKGSMTALSIYREILFYTLSKVGQDKIDLLAFDREYRKAYEKIKRHYKEIYSFYAEPPRRKAIACRTYFRELTV